jgi:ATP-dependent DNA ligase
MLHHAQQVMQTKPHMFPAPQPISVERIHFGQLNSHPYVVSPKADGERFLLVALGDRSVLINRGFEETDIKFRFKKNAFEGTILDVEKIGNRILVFDAYQVNGDIIKDRGLDERLERATALVKSVLKTSKDPFKLEMKPVFERDELEKAIKSDFGYETDGLIFTPKDEPARVGTHETMFKWKPLEKNTVDFQVVPSTRMHDCRQEMIYGYDLYVQERGKKICEGRLPQDLVEPHWRPIMDSGKDHCLILECEYIQGEVNFWRPIGIRRDKMMPNSRRTFQRTLVNIEEDIQWKEFK